MCRLKPNMPDKAAVIIVAQMGAPTIWVERLMSEDSKLALWALQDVYNIGKYARPDLINTGTSRDDFTIPTNKMIVLD